MIKRYIQRMVVEGFQYLIGRLNKSRMAFWMSYDDEFLDAFNEFIDGKVDQRYRYKDKDLFRLVGEKLDDKLNSPEFMDDLVNRINNKQLKRG